jgi:pyrroline-5-carboxylate reductase
MAMPEGPARLPLLLVGAGALGGSLIAGWRRAAAFPMRLLLIRDPWAGAEARAATADGAQLDPADADLERAEVVVLAVKPKDWRATAAEIAPLIGGRAIVVSVMAGVGAEDLAQAFPGRPVVRAMPTLASAIGQGATAIWSADPAAAQAVAALFAPLGAVTNLPREELMHAATAASGSAPGYLYAFVEALEAAAVAAGLAPAEAAGLARASVAGAAALMAQSGEAPADLRQRVTSPGGTTEAALAVLSPALTPLLTEAVAAAAARSRELAK